MSKNGDFPNFLKETIGYMKDVHENPEDVEFVGSRDRKINIGGWDGFKALADFIYNEGYGGNEPFSDIIIAFNDGSVLFRESYDGSSWWSFIRGKGNKNVHKQLVMNISQPLGDTIPLSLKSLYENQLEKEAKADIYKKMKELEEL